MPLSFAQVEQLWQNTDRELQLAHNPARGAAVESPIAAPKPNPTRHLTLPQLP